MISRTYDQGAKPLVSLCEMNPFVCAGFPPRRGPKAQWREIDGAFGFARRTSRDPGFGGKDREMTREWRRKPLKSPKMDSTIDGLAVVGKENRSSEFRLLRGRDAFAEAPVLEQASAA